MNNNKNKKSERSQSNVFDVAQRSPKLGLGSFTDVVGCVMVDLLVFDFVNW